MDTAKTMLEQGYSCSMVAEALNYSQIYAFSKAFKKHFGISPIEYKRSIAPPKKTNNKKYKQKAAYKSIISHFGRFFFGVFFAFLQGN